MRGLARIGGLLLLLWQGMIGIGHATAIESTASRASLWSTTLQEWRGVIVRLPDSYQESLQTYPVIYLLDGDAHYYHVAGIAQFLADNEMMPQVIVVAVPNGVVTRSRDLTPPSKVEAEIREGTGAAASFRDFLTRELAPWVEQHYRTAPFKILIGHSYGGLFALDTLRTQPESFNAYLVLDPSLWYDRQSLVRELPSSLAKLDSSRFRYLYTAGIDSNQALKQFSKGVGAVSGITICSREPRAGENHNSLVHLAIYDGLQQLFADWSAWPALDAAATAGRDTWSAIVEYHRQLTLKYGFTVQPSAKTYLRAAYHYLPQEPALGDARTQHNAIRAVEILEQAAQVYPGLFRQRVFALRAAGRFAEALRVARQGLNYYAARTAAGKDFLELQRQIDALNSKATETSHAH